MTMTLISTTTVGGGSASTINFSSIPQVYTDLLLLINGRSNNASLLDGITLSLNGSSSSFNYRSLIGNGSSVSSTAPASNNAGWVPAATSTSNVFGNTSIYLSNYASASNKTYSVDSVIENNATTSRLEIDAGLWSNTAAITSISLGSSNSSSYAPNTTVSLYGILKGSGGATVS
jgi:hypothetical protein